MKREVYIVPKTFDIFDILTFLTLTKATAVKKQKRLFHKLTISIKKASFLFHLS